MMGKANCYAGGAVLRVQLGAPYPGRSHGSQDRPVRRSVRHPCSLAPFHSNVLAGYCYGVPPGLMGGPTARVPDTLLIDRIVLAEHTLAWAERSGIQP